MQQGSVTRLIVLISPCRKLNTYKRQEIRMDLMFSIGILNENLRVYIEIRNHQTQGGHKPGKLRAFEKLSESQGKLREI